MTDRISTFDADIWWSRTGTPTANALSWLTRRRRAAVRLAQSIRDAWATGDVRWLRDLSIQARFTILIGVVTVAAILVGGVYAYGGARISAAIADQAEYQRMERLAASMRAGSLAMQTASNGLVAEHQQHFIGEFDKNLAEVNAALAAIKASRVATAHGAEIAQLTTPLTQVAAHFRRVTDLTVKLGLTEDDGLRGSLNKSVNAIEAELQMWPNTEDLVNRMLRMRQAEKDFMLTQDRSFLGRNRKYSAEFDLAIDSAGITASVKTDFHAMATKYGEDMAAYGETYLAQQAAIVELRAAFADLQPRIQAFAEMAYGGAAAETERQNSIRDGVSLMTAMVGGLSLACVLLVGLVSARSIARPVLAMEKAMNRLARGENTIDIPGTHRADEVGVMAKAVQVFRDNALAMEELRVRQAAEQAAKELRSQKLDALIRSFDADVGAIIGAVAEAASESQHMARGMDTFIGDTVTQMQAVDQSSGAASANVQAMAAAAEELAFSVAEISRRVNEASQVAGRAASAAEKTDTIVHNLFDVTQSIERVVTYIRAIAGKTQLLALNATIEAARAGEHGQGFTIVANEVKQLASETTRATEDIVAQIAAVQTAGREAVAAIEEIAASVARVNEISGSIAAAVEEQGVATQEIARSARESARSSAMVATSIGWVVGSAGEMHGSAKSMLNASQDLTAQSEVLRAVVDNFLSGVHDGEPCLKWGDNWRTGHPAIDRDHEMLVQYVNELSSAMMRGQGRDVIGSILDKLSHYTCEHFGREETIWTDGRLAGLEQHRESHAQLAAKVEKFVAEFHAGKASLTMDVVAFLRDWLMDHVFRVDKAAAATLVANRD